MKIVHDPSLTSPEPPKLTFGELQRGEKFYHADLPEGAAGLHQKLGGCGGNLVLNLEYYPDDPSVYTLEASCPVRRADIGAGIYAAPKRQRGLLGIKSGEVFEIYGIFWLRTARGYCVSVGDGSTMVDDFFETLQVLPVTSCQFVHGIKPPA